MKTAEKTVHTPGPWEVKPAEADRDYIRVRGTVLGGEFKIANVPFLRVPFEDWVTEKNQAKAEANARLIASAPELLSALQNIREHMVGMAAYFANCNKQVIIENLETTIRVLRDKTDRANGAIRKARGEQ